MPLFNDMFTATSHNHNHIKRGSVNHFLIIPQGKTTHSGDYPIRSAASKVWNNPYRFSNCNILTAKILNLKTRYSRSFLIRIAMIIRNQLCLSLFFFYFFSSLIWFSIQDSMTMDCNTILLTPAILNIQLLFKCKMYIENYI